MIHISGEWAVRKDTTTMRDCAGYPNSYTIYDIGRKKLIDRVEYIISGRCLKELESRHHRNKGSRFYIEQKALVNAYIEELRPYYDRGEYTLEQIEAAPESDTVIKLLEAIMDLKNPESHDGHDCAWGSESEFVTFLKKEYGLDLTAFQIHVPKEELPWWEPTEFE